MAINSRYLLSGQKTVSFGHIDPKRKNTEKSTIKNCKYFLNLFFEEKNDTGLFVNIPTVIYFVQIWYIFTLYNRFWPLSET